MADPRLVGAGVTMVSHVPGMPRPLTTMERINRAKSMSEKLNLCPFGCTDEEIDENFYCRHLIGFTNSMGEPHKLHPMYHTCKPGATYEPREFDQPISKHSTIIVKERVNGAAPLPILKDDLLLPITSSARVYRDVDKQQEPVKKIKGKKKTESVPTQADEQVA